MDETQKLALFRAIAISTASSPDILTLVNQQSRTEAFNTLEEFKRFPGRAAVILHLLQTERHILPLPNNTTVDITASTKLYTLGVLQSFLKTDYAKLSNECDRLSLRNAVMASARQLLAKSSEPNSNPDLAENENRFLAVKIAALIADIATREFPQRWTNFITEIFSPPAKGGLWYLPPPSNSPPPKGYGQMIGIKMCLECLKIITEDCTDGDFNTKISTTRRNDVLIGLNEINQQFLPLMFDLLSSQYAAINAARASLNDMANYLIGNNRTVSQMTAEEKPMWDQQIQIKNNAGRVVADCLKTLEKFATSMPTNWLLSSLDSEPNSIPQNKCDFVAALLHLLREDTADLQTLAVACLQQIVFRKIDSNEWFRLVSMFPNAINEANEASTKQDQISDASQGKVNDSAQSLVDKFPFHRALSKMLASTLSAHVAHITNDKRIIQGRGARYQTVSTFLNLLADMLSHPSPKICAEQNNTWAVLLRDPQICKIQTRLLQPCFERLLVAYTTHLKRIRWEDVEEQTHPLSALLEESFDDYEEYNHFLGDFRSKANIIIRLIGGIEPKLCTMVIHKKFENLFTTYGSGTIRDHLNPSTGQLTQKSTAVMELEGFNLPLGNVIHGLPPWALDETKTNDPSFMDPNRVQIRNVIRSTLGDIASKIIAWNPTDTWLKFRRVTLIEAFKHYWEYDAPRLISAVNVFLECLGDDSSPLPLNTDESSLRKKAGVSLVEVTKKVPHLLVGWLGQLSERVRALLSMGSILPANRMHLYEFLSLVATSVQDPNARSNFVADVLSDALNRLQTPLVKDAISSTAGLLSFVGVTDAGINPASVTDKANVDQITNNYVYMFSAFNQLLSVGKRCHEAARKRPNAGIPLPDNQLLGVQNHFPDEGSVSISDLSMNDPFVPLWPKILPSLIQLLDSLFTMWHPINQARYLKNSIQRYAYAISDDEAYLAKKQGSLSNGGVFGEGGTAGSVVSGWDRRQNNLAPKWSGWFSELRNTCLQLLGLISGQRVLFAPELAPLYPNLVNVISNPDHLKAMEHRHLTQYIKQFMDYLLLSCPSMLYQSHVAPIAAPFFEHMEHRLKCSWGPILNAGVASPDSMKPMTTSDCDRVADMALRGGDEWIVSYYGRACVFVGDLDAVTSEAMVEKLRVELSRCYADMLQTALALKGDWALVLANVAREEHMKKGNENYRSLGPKSKVYNTGGPVNADGTARSKFHAAIEGRKQQRIDKMCHFLLLENETIAGFLALSVVECLNYPDAYTCRRCLKICHRILETVAWVDRYTNLLGSQMLTNAIRGVVFEQKWMVGLEWDMINVIRDVYCRLVLGQSLQWGGQGAAMQTPKAVAGSLFEQTKLVNKPLQGGGILCSPSDLPRQVLAALPGISPDTVVQLEAQLKEKRSAKDQKDALRDLLRVAADNLKQNESNNGLGLLGRADASESCLNQKEKARKNVIQDLPEKLVTQSMMAKKNETGYQPSTAEMGGSLFG